MFRNLLMIIMILFSITLLGCSKPDSNLPRPMGSRGIEQPSENHQVYPRKRTIQPVSHAGHVIQEHWVAGDNYSDEIVEEGGYFGESLSGVVIMAVIW